MKMSVDTEKMKDAGQEILDLSREYSEIIDTFFNKIDGYSNADIWVGPAAENYISRATAEKSAYDNIGTIINSYGKVLIRNAEQFEDFIREAE